MGGGGERGGGQEGPKVTERGHQKHKIYVQSFRWEKRHILCKSSFHSFKIPVFVLFVCFLAKKAILLDLKHLPVIPQTNGVHRRL